MTMIYLKFEKCSDTAMVPTKAHNYDAAFDLFADIPDQHYYEWNDGLEGEPINGIKVRPHTTAIIHTGIKTEIPCGYYAAIHARSGWGIKRGMRLANCTGIIDAGYRDEWLVALYNDSDETRIVKHGDRIAQFILCPVLDVNLIEVDKVNTDNDRGGGLGSSGM